MTASTTYYVRAYATNSAGTGYGPAMSFTTLNKCVPRMEYSNVSFTNTTVTITINITTDGGSLITARGIQYYGGGSSPIIDVPCGSGRGKFTNSISGLISGHDYYYKGYASNGAGTGYSAVYSFRAQ